MTTTIVLYASVRLFPVLIAWGGATLLSDDVDEQQALKSLRRGTTFLRSLAVSGGYAGIYSLDLTSRFGESLHDRLKPTEVWIQPPGTPSEGELYLRLFRLTRDAEWLQAAAEVGRCLAWVQSSSGGWDYVGDISSFQPGFRSVSRKPTRCTFDDDTSAAALRLLMHLHQENKEPWLSDAVQLALDHVIRAQFANGAWPQRFPLVGGYADYYTYNDGVINSCIITLLEAHRLYGEDKYLQAARRGGDFMVRSRFPAPLAGWAQQYSHDMQPAWARAFEPPAVDSSVTAQNVSTLLELYRYTKERSYFDAAGPAVKFLEAFRIDKDRWARFYELGTNRPIYGDSDGKIHYTLEEISVERQKGYAWQGPFTGPSAIRYYHRLEEVGIERYVAEQSQPPSEREFRRQRNLALRIMAEQDERGRWTRNGYLYVHDFVKSMNTLCDYLEEVRKTRAGP